MAGVTTISVNRPIYGSLSVGLPLLSIGAEAMAYFVWSLREHGRTEVILLFSVLAMLLLGIGFGIAGLIRNERLRWLAMGGLIINLLLIPMHFLAF